MNTNHSSPLEKKVPIKNLTILVWVTILFLTIPQIIIHLFGWDLPEGPLDLSWVG